jgi:predicted HicB family RNase H-like nuclease
MADPIRYSNSMTVRCAPEMTALISRAARSKGTKPTEYIRQALRAALAADGADLEPSKQEK